MRSLWLLSAFIAGASTAVCGLQAKTPQGALEEIATAEQPEAIERHLPEPVQKTIEELPGAQKKKIMDALLALKSEHLDGGSLRRSSDGDGWEFVDKERNPPTKVKVTNVFFSGIEALLTLTIESEEATQELIVSMHLEGTDWRIDNFGQWMKQDLGLKKLLHVSTEAEKNEVAARETLETIVNALRRYAMTGSRMGYPSILRPLTNSTNSDNSEDRPLLEPRFGDEPVVFQGYEFRYRLISPGSGANFIGANHFLIDVGEFQLTATPVEFGKTGNKNFFVDQSGRIKSTSQNRPATEDDDEWTREE